MRATHKYNKNGRINQLIKSDVLQSFLRLNHTKKRSDHIIHCFATWHYWLASFFMHMNAGV